MRTLLHTYFTLALLLVLTSCGTNAPDSQSSSSAVPTAEVYGGLALYTLRDTMSGDPRAVLREVADQGYAYIEAAGYRDGKFYGMAPADFRAYLDEVGLQPMSSHHGDITIDGADKVIADLKAAGFRYLVIPVPPMGAFQFNPETRELSMNKTTEEVMADINAIAEKCAAAGIRCLYHNHDFEFKPDENGTIPIDYFLENSDPEKLNFQMDLYWVTKAGADPVDYFQRYPGRFKSWHVKDMDDQGRFAPVGEGTIDFARILAEKELSGMEFYLVEQDMTFNETPLEAIVTSHGALQRIGFK